MRIKFPWSKPTLGQQLLRGGLQGLVVGGAFMLGGLVIEGAAHLVRQGLKAREQQQLVADNYAAATQSQQTRPVA
jgi:hypothetical protein